MRLLIIRHGETVDNIANRIQGQSQGQLTEQGLRQADALASRLVQEQIDLIISSDLRRAVDTTERITSAAFRPVEYDPLLRERDFGSLVGVSFDEYRRHLDESGMPFFSYRPPGGESLVDLQGRVKKFIARRADLWERDNVLLSAHGQTNRMLLRVLIGTPFEEWLGMKQGNCCLNILEGSSPETMRPIKINCLTHLPQADSGATATAG